MLGLPLGGSAGGRVRCRRLGWGGCADCWAGRERHRRAAWARPTGYPPSGLGGCAAGGRVRRVMLCGARGFRGAAGATGVCASALVGWQGGVCARGWAWGDDPQAHSFPLSLLEGFLQAFEDIRVVLVSEGGCGGGLPGDGAHQPAWLPMRPVASNPPPPSGGGSSLLTPCRAGGPSPRGRTLPGPTFADP